MNNRIIKLFSQKQSGLLSVYYTAGFPGKDDTLPIARALQDGGADIIEIGIPFSDPVADGPTIQESNKVALDQGITLPQILVQVGEIRKAGVHLPIILMGYLNPVMQYGVERFVKDAAAAGVDGLIIPDMPVYEFEESYRDLFETHNLCNTFLISPTTSEDRIRRIDAATKGFIYAVSSSSTTGAKGEFTSEQLAYFKRLQALNLNNPYLIGFGISNRETFSTASAHASGAIVGSAFINLLKDSKDLKNDIIQFVKQLKGK